MSDSPVRGPFSHPSELGNVFQLMLDTFVEYDTSGDQRLHTRKELSLDNVTAAAIDNYNGESDGRITKFELKKAFRQWPNVTRFLNFAPKVDELWDTKVHNGSMQLVRSTDAGFNIMSDATSILKRLPLGVAMKVAQRLYDFAHDFRYYCSVFKKKNLLEKYHSLLLAMSSEKWLGTTDPEKLKTGIKALEVMHARLKKVRNPEIFLKRFEVVARMGGAKGILLTEKMYQVREKLQDTPVNKGEKVLAILNTDTGAVRYMTIKKKNEAGFK